MSVEKLQTLSLGTYKLPEGTKSQNEAFNSEDIQALLSGAKENGMDIHIHIGKDGEIDIDIENPEEEPEIGQSPDIYSSIKKFLEDSEKEKISKEEVNGLLDQKQEYVDAEMEKFLAENPEPPSDATLMNISLKPGGGPHAKWEAKREAALKAAEQKYAKEHPEESKKIDNYQQVSKEQKQSYLAQRRQEFLADNPEPPADDPLACNINPPHMRWEVKYAKFMKESEQTYYNLNPGAKEIDEKYEKIENSGESKQFELFNLFDSGATYPSTYLKETVAF